MIKILEQAQQIATTGYCDSVIEPIDCPDLPTQELKILNSILKGPFASMAIVALQKAGLFKYLIPEIENSINLYSEKKFKQIWPHTLQVINQTPQIVEIRWAALFHDLGKPQAFEIKDNKVTFHNHENISASIFDRFANKTKIFPFKAKAHIKFLIANLGYIEGYNYSWTESAVRRFGREMGDQLDWLFLLSKADITTSSQIKKANIIKRMDALKNRIDTLKAHEHTEVLPKGIGFAIANTLNIPLDKRIGNYRELLEKKISEKILLPNQNYEYYLDYLRNNPE